MAAVVPACCCTFVLAFKLIFQENTQENIQSKPTSPSISFADAKQAMRVYEVPLCRWFCWEQPQFQSPINKQKQWLGGLWLALWEPPFLAFFICFGLSCIHLREVAPTLNVLETYRLLLEMSCEWCSVQNRLVRGLASLILCHLLLRWMMWISVELHGKSDSNNQLSLHRAFLHSNKSDANFY